MFYHPHPKRPTCANEETKPLRSCVESYINTYVELWGEFPSIFASSMPAQWDLATAQMVDKHFILSALISSSAFVKKAANQIIPQSSEVIVFLSW